ncbi:MAG: T9SS type A sorting domain-containing protein, partial [Candidatus Cloacimonadota bacterium]
MKSFFLMIIVLPSLVYGQDLKSVHSLPLSHPTRQVPLETIPFWTGITADTRDIAFGDINGDGFLDLVVGNEVQENATHIYFNTGTGLETSPSIILPDSGSWPVAFGDVDNDGDLDLATGYTAFGGYHARLYLNQGGTIDTIADWIGSTGATWLGWADVDGDGDLDLAAADLFAPASVYYNNNGTLESSPSWQATDGHSWDMAGTWFDVDDDGDLDLAVGLENRIYTNQAGTLETVASWQADLPYYDYGYGFSAGDVDQDGLLDLGVGGQSAGSGVPNFLHFNSLSGMETTPSWISGDVAATWRVAFADVDGDGYLDLATANYGEQDVVYLNTGGTLETNPSWSSSPAENSIGIAWGDVDGDGVLNKTDTLTGDGVRKLFYLSHFPAHTLDSVSVDGATLPLSDYCFDLVAGWVSLKNIPANGSQILLFFSYSIDLDLAVGSNPPVLYRSTNVGIKEQKALVFPDKISIKNNPNPFRDFTEILFTLPQSEEITIYIYDISGRMIKQIYSGIIRGGKRKFLWKGKDNKGKQVSSGVYFIKLQSKNTNISKPIILIKER